MDKIITQRLLLRPWEENDDIFIAREFGNYEVRRLMADVPHGEYGLKEARDFINIFSHKEGSLQFAFVDKETGILVGGGGFTNLDKTNQKGEVGYWIAKNYWGKGYATEATLALLKYGFENIDLHRIEISAESENFGSLAVIKKCRFTPEGVLRKNFLIENKWMDTCLFAMLKEEWTLEKK